MASPDRESELPPGLPPRAEQQVPPELPPRLGALTQERSSPPQSYVELGERAYMAYTNFEISRHRTYSHCNQTAPHDEAMPRLTRRGDPLMSVKLFSTTCQECNLRHVSITNTDYLTRFTQLPWRCIHGRSIENMCIDYERDQPLISLPPSIQRLEPDDASVSSEASISVEKLQRDNIKLVAKHRCAVSYFTQLASLARMHNYNTEFCPQFSIERSTVMLSNLENNLEQTKELINIQINALTRVMDEFEPEAEDDNSLWGNTSVNSDPPLVNLLGSMEDMEEDARFLLLSGNHQQSILRQPSPTEPTVDTSRPPSVVPDSLIRSRSGADVLVESNSQPTARPHHEANVLVLPSTIQPHGSEENGGIGEQPLQVNGAGSQILHSLNRSQMDDENELGERDVLPEINDQIQQIQVLNQPPLMQLQAAQPREQQEDLHNDIQLEAVQMQHSRRASRVQPPMMQPQVAQPSPQQEDSHNNIRLDAVQIQHSRQASNTQHATAGVWCRYCNRGTHNPRNSEK